MGFGDNIIATGLAKGAEQRRKRVAFGDGQNIIWDQHSELIFRDNPNIAPPGSECDDGLEWVLFYRGHRGYNTHDRAANRWRWNEKWRCEPGEIYFRPTEQDAGRRYGRGFVLIEPHVEYWKASAKNKDWGFHRYQELAHALCADGHRVVQFNRPGALMLGGAESFKTRDFRDAAAILANALLYIGPEGGLHHAAAAVRTRAVVIFGSWIPPQVTGYDMHTNITAPGDHLGCGALQTCGQCLAALKRLRVGTVHAAAKAILEG